MSGSIRVGENKHSFRTHSTAMYWSLHSEELMHSRTTWNEGQQRVCEVEHATVHTTKPVVAYPHVLVDVFRLDQLVR